MNILFYVDFPLGGRGGVERVLSTYYQALSADHHIQIVLAHQSMDSEWEEGLPVLHLMKTPIKAARGVDISGYLNRFTKVLFEQQLPIDCMVTLGTRSTKIAKLAAQRLGLNTKVISWLQLNTDHVLNNKDDLRYADGHLAITQALKEEIEQATESSSIHVVYNPLNIHQLPLIPRPEFPEFAYVGRLTKEKRVEDILVALSRINPANWKLHIFGEGDELPNLAASAHTLGIESKVVFHGWTPNPWNNLEKCTALIHASESESFGLALVEALSCGIPVLASDCPYGPREIIDGTNGWLYPVGDVDALSSLVSEILLEKRRLPAPEACIASVRKFSADSVIPRFLTALTSMVSDLPMLR
ncbi:glycosyltransferase [Gorillibacterium sp. CAU 1737]|uniref:glycosyltransferase n=1 Tax=Gorillibacterium sp. CAU 1737 TaxID=3140362 RepID=UPI003260AE88